MRARRREREKKRVSEPGPDASVDVWKAPAWDDDDAPGPMLEESSFATLFPQYRELYLKKIWPSVERTLDKFNGIATELDLVEGSMTVRTTKKTRDPFAILKARDLIKLLSRSIPVEKAVDVLKDDVQCDVIRIGGMVGNKERFVKRRRRLVGPEGQTLKAIELLTKCYVLVQGNTVAAMGSHEGLKKVRKIVEDCMRNVHPIYGIKRLMVMRELEKDPALKNESWERFLPKFEKRHQSRKSRKAAAERARARSKKRERYTPFPPAQPMSKLDKELETGEYFMKEAAREAARKQEKREKSREAKRRRRAREEATEDEERQRQLQPEGYDDE